MSSADLLDIRIEFNELSGIGKAGYWAMSPLILPEYFWHKKVIKNLQYHNSYQDIAAQQKKCRTAIETLETVPQAFPFLNKKSVMAMIDMILLDQCKTSETHTAINAIKRMCVRNPSMQHDVYNRLREAGQNLNQTYHEQRKIRKTSTTSDRMDLLNYKISAIKSTLKLFASSSKPPIVQPR